MPRGKNYEFSKNCVDCGEVIGRRAIRCSSCAARFRWTSGVYEGSFGEEFCWRKSREAKQRWESGFYDDLFDEECLRKRSVSLKAAHARGTYDDECRRKISEGLVAAWSSGSSKFGTLGWRHKISVGVSAAWSDESLRKRQSESRRAAWARGDYDGIFQSPTSIELQVSTALDIMGIDHECQYRPRGYTRIYDEFVLPNILIEVHGDYWHSLPESKKRDAEKAQWAEDNGYSLVVIWEHEIKQCGAQAIVTERLGGVV